MDVAAVTDIDELASCGVRVFGDLSANEIRLPSSLRGREKILDVHFRGVGNSLTLKEGCTTSGVVGFSGNGAKASIGGFAHTHHLVVWVYGGSEFHWGDRSVAYGVRAWVDGGMVMSVGDDCLFSEGIEMRTSDHHSLIDLTTMTQVNFPADLSIGRHVWIGPSVSILKGVSIGDGSVVGAASVVTRPIGRNELWAGSPARKVRGDISWVDSHPAAPEQISGLTALGLVAA